MRLQHGDEVNEKVARSKGGDGILSKKTEKVPYPIIVVKTNIISTKETGSASESNH